MARLLVKKSLFDPLRKDPLAVFRRFRFCSEAFGIENDGRKELTLSDKFSMPPKQFSGIRLPPLIPSSKDYSEGFNIELVDPDLWQVSFGLAQSWEDAKLEDARLLVDESEKVGDSSIAGEEFLEFDKIEDLRLRKKLFYKLDRGSKEFEENNFSFYKKKSSKRNKEKLVRDVPKKESKKMENLTVKHLSGATKLVERKIEKGSPQERRRLSSGDGENGMMKQQSKASIRGTERALIENGRTSIMPHLLEGKKVRTPTYNQLTDPYHLPFCLDIFVTKGSVRASIIHRVTSRVVAVAHSISRDMKFDLTSKKNSKACSAVGGILAQRAIEDDIHNVVYTPRKGDKIEGKLQIVLESVINSGVDVKVKLKQKKPMKKAQISPVQT